MFYCEKDRQFFFLSQRVKRYEKKGGDRFVKKRDIPIGISDFEKIRQCGYYYVDKSKLIYEILQEESTEVTLITRPRRFGKTLNMSMLAAFFDIRKESKLLFEHLEISSDTELCEKWRNQYPTIFLTLKNIDGLDFSTAYNQLAYEISNLFETYDYVLQSNKISDNEKNTFERIKTRTATKIELYRSLQFLLHLLNCYYEKKVILLLDEYDVPLAKASANNYYDQMLEVIKAMMTTALKDNRSLQFAIITGCLKISKESIFTGTNNFVSDTITDSRLNEYFGFTQREVEQILKDVDETEHMSEIKEWYDGYHFGTSDVYCPWDVMNYVRKLQYNPSAKPTSYWKNTSDNAIIRSFIDYAGSNITKKLEVLLSGGVIVQRIDEELTYDYLHSSEENLWSILYLTGYLTSVREKSQRDEKDGIVALKIPNAEIKEIFETTIQKWFDDSVKMWDRKALFHAVWIGDTEMVMQEMNKLLRRTISYYDYRENFYHAFLAGIFAGAGYMVDSNKEHGEGRSDIVVHDTIGAKVAIFEVKYSKKMENMEKDCERAIDQMEQRMYAKEYEEDYDTILCYGISFFKKRCFVRKKA